jgi:chaperonin GroES
MFNVQALLKLATWAPQYDRVMVLPFVKATASRAGLVQPGENREKPEMGVVIAVGPGGIAPESGRPVVVMAQPGEIVLYGKYAGQAIDSEDAAGDPLDLFIMRDIEILGKRTDYDPADIEIHDDDPRKIHFKGLVCEHCPQATSSERLASFQAAAGLGESREEFERDRMGETGERLSAESRRTEEEKSTLIAEERERLRLARQSADVGPRPVGVHED